MPLEFTNAELEAYLDESLPIERMTAIEEALRRRSAAGAAGGHQRPPRRGRAFAGRNLAAPPAQLPVARAARQLLVGRAAGRRGRLREVPRRDGRMPLLRGKPGRISAPSNRPPMPDKSQQRRQRYFQSSAAICGGMSDAIDRRTADYSRVDTWPASPAVRSTISGCLLQLAQRPQIRKNLIPIEHSFLPCQNALYIDPILWPGCKRFSNYHVFGRCGRDR